MKRLLSLAVHGTGGKVGAPAAAAGDAAALARSHVAELYRVYGPVVYRRCLRLLKDPEAARDGTQEVFAKLLRDMVKLEDRQTVVPWMYRVATNYCLNLRRNAHRRGEDHEPPALEPACASAADGHIHRALAQSVLSRFDVATQAIAVAVYVDGMEHQEVAATLGISRRTVARKLERFLEGAREYVDGSGTAAEPKPAVEPGASNVVELFKSVTRD
jgi:RNA polymerase sigma-70 factor, ECF subfamily